MRLLGVLQRTVCVLQSVGEMIEKQLQLGVDEDQRPHSLAQSKRGRVQEVINRDYAETDCTDQHQVRSGRMHT